MAVSRSFLTRGVPRRPNLGPIDLVVGAGVAAMLVVIVRLGHDITARGVTAHVSQAVSTAPANLPYYAARSLLRMFIALGLAVLFTLTYGTAAARLRRARVIMIPILDILQSVPILGFLPILVAFFVTLFPNSVLGLELASIFAVFTSKAWNMTFSFYHSIITQPKELDEAARMFRLSKWERFWRLDVPSSMIGLVWNGMMSFGGGWFFLAASEAIAVLGHNYYLPGIGSYMAQAAEAGNLKQVGLAIVTMVIMVIGVNVLFWRPLVAWAEKFRVETSEATDQPRSATLGVLRRSHIPAMVGRPLKPVGEALNRATRPFGLAEYPLHSNPTKRRAGDVVFGIVVSAVVFWGVYEGYVYLSHNGGFGQFVTCFKLGFYTLLRVTLCVLAATLVWVPVGVAIGMNPRLSRYAQPVVQVAASFPAILLSPSPSWCSWASASRCHRRHIPDGIGGPVVHLVQRHSRRQRHPDRHPRAGRPVPSTPQPAVARTHPAGHLPLLPDRRHHCRRGRVEHGDRG